MNLLLGPKIGTPFDLVVSCTTDNFKFYVNDVFVADFSKLHILSTNVRATPLVKTLSYSADGMKITKMSWNYG